MLDPGQRAFAVGADGSLGGLLDLLCHVTSAGGEDGADARRLGVVGMTSRTRDSVVWHI